MAEPHVHIRYVGKWSRKPDNIVPSSGRVWPSPGATLRIPESQAYLYLKHPDEFEQVTPELVASDLANKLSDVDQVQFIVDTLPFLDAAGLQTIADAIVVHQSALKAVSRTTSAPMSSADATWVATRMKAIGDALATMEPMEDRDYTSGGKPRVSRVQEITKLVPEVTAREIEAAQAATKR